MMPEMSFIRSPRKLDEHLSSKILPFIVSAKIPPPGGYASREHICLKGKEGCFLDDTTRLSSIYIGIAARIIVVCVTPLLPHS